MKDNLLNWKLCKVKKNLIIANDFERWKPIFHVVLFTQTWEQLSLKTNKLSCFISFKERDANYFMNCFDAKLSNERMLSKWKIIEKVFDDNYLAFLKKIITNFDCGKFETHVCFVLILTNMLHFPWDVPQVLRNVVTTLKFYLCKFYVRKFTEICMVTYTPKNYDRNGKKMITKLLMI